ncbi:hypothetical protein H5V45_03760 [Nocardioides sp. KIGAM211]|uniref:Fibronectin type-III domain-containing protein n=1 Tax=Nocardioides luti TaxID=2761101 RepID=A0A7X0RDV4_9ACTN|nr:hypothetical protein [Nocardioides luti]MBB6626432.1 hypothetical protein [Nocardioides luti]
MHQHQTRRRRTRHLLGAVLATVLVVASVPASALGSAPARGVPAPSHLSPSGTVSTHTPTLSWKRAKHAERYQVQADDSSGFASPLLDVTTTNRRLVPTVALPTGTVRWRVRAVASSGRASGWRSASFKVSETAAPAPIAPVEGAALPQPAKPALLSWAPVRGATGYDVEIDSDGDWVDATAYSSPGPELQVPVPQAPQQWSWRVRAELGGGNVSLWSAGSTYEILPLDAVRIDPSMSTTTLTDVALKWLPVPGATRYELQVGLDRDFTQPVETRTVTGTRYSPPTTYDNDQYFWRVRAIDPAGTKAPWPAEPFQVQRNWPERPQLLYPPDSVAPAVSDDFYYQWTPVPHASSYQLRVGTDPNFSPGTFEVCATAQTTYTAGYRGDRCMPGQGQTYYWEVRALDAPRNAPVEGIYSEIHRFAYDSGKVRQVAPTEGAAVATPALRWEAATDAVAYYVEVKNAVSTVVAKTTTNSLSWTPEGKALDATKGPFSWTVQSIDDNGSYSPLYSGSTFSLAGAPPTSGAAPLTPLVGPDGESSLRFPCLTWEPMDGATSYRLRLKVHGADYWDPATTSRINTASYAYPSATDTGDHYLSAGSYDWQVQAYGANGALLSTGPIGTFTIAELGAVTGQRIALDGLALDSGAACNAALPATVTDDFICTGVPATPVLDWTPVAGAGFYMVYLANDRELTNRVYGDTIHATAGSRWTPRSLMDPSQLADNQAGQSYYWIIRPCKTESVCAPDPISTHAAATNAFRKISPSPELVAPGANPSNTCTDTTTVSGAVCSDDIALSWADYYDTNQKTSYPPAQSGAPTSSQTAQRYLVQVATSDTFTTLVDSREVDQTTYTAFDRTWPEGLLYWRVQAIDDEDNHLKWSAPATFTKQSDVVTLTRPTAGAKVGGSSPFVWEAHDGAASYQLEVYRGDDATFSPANKVLGVTTKLVAYNWSRFLPAATSAYRWRVRWTDAGGHVGAWADSGRFFVQRGGVGLASPKKGATVRGDEALFKWQSTPSASSYRVDLRNRTTGSSLWVQTPGLSWAPTSTLDKGRWTWQVTAYDPSGGSLGTSAKRGFRVKR